MRTLVFASLMLVSGLLSACNDTYVPRPVAPVEFTGIPYNLNVANIAVAEDYKTTKQPPHVEGLADVPPAAMFRQWVDSRLAAGGRTGHAEIVIADASIIRRDLGKQKSGVEGYFTTEQTEEYRGRLDVQIKIYNDTALLPIGQISVGAKNMHTLSEKATQQERNALYHDMGLELIKLLEPQIDQNIQAHFSSYLL